MLADAIYARQFHCNVCVRTSSIFQSFAYHRGTITNLKMRKLPEFMAMVTNAAYICGIPNVVLTATNRFSAYFRLTRPDSSMQLNYYTTVAWLNRVNREYEQLSVLFVNCERYAIVESAQRRHVLHNYKFYYLKFALIKSTHTPHTNNTV